MIDLEFLGINSGPAEIGVFMTLRTHPAWRRQHEDEILQIYYDALIESGTKYEHANITRESYTFEQCKHDYAFHGFTKLIFYYTVFASHFDQHTTQSCMDNMLDLAKQYEITPENCHAYLF